MTPNKRLAEQIRKGRERLGMSQAALAEASGLPAFQTISEIELAKRDVRATELSRIARALHLSFSALLGDAEIATPLVLWRNRPANEKETESRFLQKCDHYKFLEEITGQTTTLAFPQKEVDPNNFSFTSAAELGHVVGREFNLGSQPGCSIAKTLEETYCVKILYSDLGQNGSAACTIGDFGPAILMNSQEAPWRRNFSFAHEVFHLVTWRSIPPQRLLEDPDSWNLVEKLANTFSAALLLPADIVLGEFERQLSNGRIKVVDLISLARKFEVSTEALLWRLVNMKALERGAVEGLLVDEEFRDMDRMSMRDKWNQPPAIPERFVRLAVLAFQRGSISRVKLAHLLDCSLIDLPDVLNRYGHNDSQICYTELSASN